MRFSPAKWLLLLALLGMAAIFSGCATEESENASVRPWNSPAGWENGGSMMQSQHR